MPQSFPSDTPAAEPPPAPQRDAAFMIVTAVILIVVAAVFGVKSFRELSAQEPPSDLRIPPRSARFAPARPALPSESVEPPEPLPPVASLMPEPVPAPPTPTVRASAPVPVPAQMTASRPNTLQVAPPQVFAQTRMQAVDPAEPAAPAVVTAASDTTPAVDDAVLLDEVKTLERRGDEIMAERRTEDALDLYSTALDTAIQYASRKGANPVAKDQVVKLQRKLGLLQTQNASTAEARASYQQARKTLLQLKSQGAWSRERAKSLDEMESRLLSLPRD